MHKALRATRGRRHEVINMELYESTWVAMSVGLSLIIGFVAFVVMMNDTKDNNSHRKENSNGKSDK